MVLSSISISIYTEHVTRIISGQRKEYETFQVCIQLLHVWSLVTCMSVKYECVLKRFSTLNRRFIVQPCATLCNL